MIKATLLLLFLVLMNPLLSQESRSEQQAPDSTVTGKPFLQRWTTHRISFADILHLPFRGLESYFPLVPGAVQVNNELHIRDRKSTRLNSSHSSISYAVFCLTKKS